MVCQWPFNVLPLDATSKVVWCACVQCGVSFQSGLQMDYLLVPSVLGALHDGGLGLPGPAQTCCRGHYGVPASCRRPSRASLQSSPAERIVPTTHIDESTIRTRHCVPTEQYRIWWAALLQSLPPDAVILFFTASTAAFLPVGTIGLPSCQVVGIPSTDRTALSLRALIPTELRRRDVALDYRLLEGGGVMFIDEELKSEMQAVVQSLMVQPSSLSLQHSSNFYPTANHSTTTTSSAGGGVSIVLNNIASNGVKSTTSPSSAVGSLGRVVIARGGHELTHHHQHGITSHAWTWLLPSLYCCWVRDASARKWTVELPPYWSHFDKEKKPHSFC